MIASTAAEFIETVIAGVGFGGIAAAHDLLQSGRTDFILLEKALEAGGVWRDNTYPNAACDVPAHLYSFSFAQNADWSCNYASQAEILQYTNRVIDELRLRERIRFNEALVRAEWLNDRLLWRLETSTGRVVECRYLISALGTLNQPLIPDLPGLADYQGQLVHTAEWRPGIEMAGKKVAVIGAGASAIQVVPYAVEQADSVLAVIRTAPHVMPKPEEVYDEPAKEYFRNHPEVLLKLRKEQYDYWNHSTQAQAVMDEGFLQAAERTWREHMEAAVSDPRLRKILTPDSRFGCRRPVVSNSFYPALADPKTTVIDSGILRFTPTGVVSEAGEEYEADIVVLATGFRATEMLSHVEIIGAGGWPLTQEWQDGPEAYKGTLVKGFPNLFLITGPNTQASGSLIGVIEAQTKYITKCLDEAVRQETTVVEVTAQAQSTFNETLDRMMEKSVYIAGGCHSWYRLGGTGRVVTKWPGSLADLEDELEMVNPDDFVFTGVSGRSLATLVND